MAVGAKGVAVGTMTSSLRGCPGNGKRSSRRDADARRHRCRRRKNQFRPWLGDRSALARRCCDAAAPLSLARRREPRFSGGAGLPTTAPLPRTTQARGREPSSGSRERPTHRAVAPTVVLATVPRAQRHITRAHTIHIHERVTHVHIHDIGRHVYARRRPRVHVATRAYVLLARATRRIAQREEQRWRSSDEKAVFAHEVASGTQRERK